MNLSLGKLMKYVLATAALACVFLLSLASCTETVPKLIPRPPDAPVPNKVTTSGEIDTNLAKIDILFVVDDSGSMSGHQTDLSTNVDQFVHSFLNNRLIDYHIGVITTTGDEYESPYYPATHNGRLQGYPAYIDSTTPDALTKLQNTLMVGTSGSGNEMVFTPTIQALTDPVLSQENAGFYRPDAYLVVVFITDAEDHSTMSSADFVQFLYNLKPGAPKKIITYAAIVPTSEVNCARDEPGRTPIRIEEVLTATNGIEFSLCAPDFGQKLASVGADLIKKIVFRSIHLSRVPAVETIKVSFGSQVIPQDKLVGWSFDPTNVDIFFGKDLVWTYQSPGTKLKVEFTPIENFGHDN
jgi:hypothetical protein